MSNTSEHLNKLSKLLSQYLNDNNVDTDQELTLILNPNNNLESNDENIIRNFFIENPESLLKLLKDKHVSSSDLAKVLGSNSSNIEGFTNSDTSFLSHLGSLLKTRINSKVTTSDVSDLRLINLCNKLSNLPSDLVHLKKQLQDMCLHGSDVWGFILDKNDEHVGVIKTDGKIETIKSNNNSDTGIMNYLNKLTNKKPINSNKKSINLNKKSTNDD